MAAANRLCVSGSVDSAAGTVAPPQHRLAVVPCPRHLNKRPLDLAPGTAPVHNLSSFYRSATLAVTVLRVSIAWTLVLGARYEVMESVMKLYPGTPVLSQAAYETTKPPSNGGSRFRRPCTRPAIPSLDHTHLTSPFPSTSALAGSESAMDEAVVNIREIIPPSSALRVTTIMASASG